MIPSHSLRAWNQTKKWDEMKFNPCSRNSNLLHCALVLEEEFPGRTSSWWRNNPSNLRFTQLSNVFFLKKIYLSKKWSPIINIKLIEVYTKKNSVYYSNIFFGLFKHFLFLFCELNINYSIGKRQCLISLLAKTFT